MPEAPPVRQDTPQDDDDEIKAEDEDDLNDAEDDATPSQASPRPSRSATPRRRGRGRGRGGRSVRSARSRAPVSEDDAPEVAVDTPPKRRGGFRGGNRGRWANRKSGIGRANLPVDDDGNQMEVEDNEVVLPELPAGEEKVMKSGELLGGREYRVRTFKLPTHGEQLYMLSTEPARCLGYRDSYLFFQKHKMLYKVLVAEDEKIELIERGIMPNSYKGRAIGMVTARSVYREFGARVVVGGRKVIDDYDEQAARERGDVEGELADPSDRLPQPGDQYDRNKYVAWFGASNVYRSDAVGGAVTGQKGSEGKRKRIVITSDNWLFEHARSSSHFNSTLAEARKANFEGLYDIHTNVMHWPQHMQSTHARWEKINGEHANNDISCPLPSLKSVYARNFRVHDLAVEAAPETSFPAPGSEVDENSLNAIPSDILDELPVECLEALQQAQSRERDWRNKWRTEKQDGMRANFLPSFEWYPKT